MGALSFKDCIAADIHQVFLNEDEFAEIHTVDGKPMRVILDDDGLQQRDAARGGPYTVKKPIQWAIWNDSKAHPYYLGAVEFKLEIPTICPEVPFT